MQDKEVNSQPRPSPQLKTLVSWNLPRKDGVPPQCNICAIHSQQTDTVTAKAITRRETRVRCILPREEGVRSQCDLCVIHGRQTGTVTMFRPSTSVTVNPPMPHCLSSNIILAKGSGASPSRGSQGGLVQWQDNKKRTRCQASTGNNAVVTELLSTTRSSVCLHGGRLSYQQASKTHQHTSARP
jgi:hypothetical protein